MKLSWVVYEHSTGSIYRVEPATPRNAKRECDLAGRPAHEAMRLDRALDLKSAFAHGRMYGHQQARGAS